MAIDLSNLNTNQADPFSTVNLEKDMFFNLEKSEPTLRKAHVGLQWDAGDDFDLDLSVFALHQNGKIQQMDDFLYFDKSVSAPGLQKSGDNRTGEGDGDDEWLDVTFDRVKPTVDRIVLVATIYKAHEKRQNFGLVRSAMVHIDNADTGRTLTQFRLTDDYSTDTTILFGELVRATDGWTFHAIGEGSNQDLQFYLDKYK